MSYLIHNATAIEHQTTIPAGGNCTATLIFVVADEHHPYNVYSTFFSSVKGINAGCGLVLSVDEDGALDAVI